MKKKVLNYLLSQQDCNCSFEDIKDKINMNNIVIKERKKYKLFPSFKLFKPIFFSLVFVLSILCSSQLTYLVLRETGNIGFETIRENYDYDNYDDFYEKYLSCYSYCNDEKEIKTIDFDLGEDVNYTYQIKLTANYNYKHKLIDVQSISLNAKIEFEQDSYYVIFQKSIDNYDNLYWEKYDIDEFNQYDLFKNNYNDKLISLFENNNSTPNLSLLKDYILEEIKK